MPYTELYCHLVWATSKRAMLLVDDRLELAERAIRATCRQEGVLIVALGMMPDHVHLAVSMPPRLSVSDLVRLVKGSSSHLLNGVPGPAERPSFAWQPEYGALSFGKRRLPSVVEYVEHQRERHAANHLYRALEITESEPPNRGPRS